MRKLIFALAFLSLTVPCLAEIFIVDPNWSYGFDNIQDAIDSSSDGDYIFVFPGTYAGAVNFLGKAVTVRSLYPTDPCCVAQTVVDCGGFGRAFNFVSGEGANSVLTGFTITNCAESAVYCYNSSPAITNCTITGNENLYGEGGGIYCESYSSPTITNCIISNNIAGESRAGGGGIFCGENSSPVITNCTITGNEIIYGDGGGIYCGYYSSPTITNSIISNNTVVECPLGGGGIFCGENSNPIITGCTISDNSAESFLGGGIYCYQSSLTITTSAITGNHSAAGGGAYCYYGSSTFTGCTISENSANDGAGGGAYCYYGSSTFTDCTISDNSADGGAGGGVYCYYNTSTLTDCAIFGNSADGGAGGGIYCYNYGGATVSYCIISGNKAVDGGGIYYGNNSSFAITNSVITGNRAVSLGGGIWCLQNGSPLPLNSCIVWNNTDSGGQGQSAQVYGDLSNTRFNCIQDDNPDDDIVPFNEDEGNIDDDPCFVDPGFWDVNGFWHNGNYHLSLTSSCIDAGDPYYIYNVGDTDMDGQPRLMGQYRDIGPDEAEISVVIVTKPQAGVVWAAGSTHRINWDIFGITTGSVDIYYSDSNGADWIEIDNDVPDNGSYIWHLPEAVDSNLCLISIQPHDSVIGFICTGGGIFTVLPYTPGQQVSSAWKSLGCDFNRSGLSQNSGPELGCVKWQFQTNGLVLASPSVGSAGRVHLACEDGVLYTIDADGLLLWSYDTNSPLLTSPSIGPDGSLYVGAENGKLYAFDTDGNLRWTNTTGGSIYSSPAVSADGNIFACSQDGALYALGPDGSELWTFETGRLSAAASGAIFASPAIGPDGTIYISGWYDPNLYALNQNDGSVKWNCIFLDLGPPYNPNPKLRPFASPVVAQDGTIYQTVFSNPKRPFSGCIRDQFWYESNLYAINPNNGNIIWQTNMTETPTEEEHIYPEMPPEDYWFKKYYTNAQQQGVPPYPHTCTTLNTNFVRYYRVNNVGLSEPALGPDGTIYVSFNDHYLRAVDPDGSIKWVTSLGWVGGFTLAVGSDGLIYAASDDGNLYVVDPDGKEIARFEGNDRLSFPVITADNSIIVCDANNIVAIANDSCQGLPAALHRPEDLNADWSMDLIDFALLAGGWLDCTDTSYDPATLAPYCSDTDNIIFPESDINRDQYVDFADLVDLANRWLNQD